jgi:ribosome-associated protein
MVEYQAGEERISKTRRKQEMHALQALGEQLVELPAERLSKIAIPQELREAIGFARTITRFEARRRQMQYIGRLMRDVDPAPIQAALDAINGQAVEETARLHRIERLRQRLIEDEQVLGEIASAFPGADLQRLRALRRNALREREAAKPPRYFRELFRALKALEGYQTHEPGE